ncbi:hypothetical protein RugamoR57_28180 [Duganella caerulea]|uniref:DUF4435 domain-containing protein n=1 Tax=Duganella caerulea TaxID=2885762 RepID=UPI0030EB01AA
MSDSFLNEMLASRSSRAVLKMDLAKLRSSLKNTLIVAMEGKGDKFVYSQWIRRILPDLEFEPFACGGKTKVLSLKAAVEADLNNLSKGVIFVIDRDFDDLRGCEPSGSLFMTDAYSVENYLVASVVVQELLTNDFDCHAQPLLRHDIIADFERLYSEFLTAMRDANRRIFLARRLGIPVVGGVPKKLSDFVVVELSSIKRTDMTPAEFIKLEREPSEEEASLYSGEFDAMEARSRHRGKFAIMFLMKWLELLALDRRAENSVWFGNLAKNVTINVQGITLGVMATRSTIPTGLPEFIQRAA